MVKYNFKSYLEVFEESNYILFVKSYYKLKPSAVKYYRRNLFTYRSRS